MSSILLIISVTKSLDMPNLVQYLHPWGEGTKAKVVLEKKIVFKMMNVSAHLEQSPNLEDSCN